LKRSHLTCHTIILVLLILATGLTSAANYVSMRAIAPVNVTPETQQSTELSRNETAAQWSTYHRDLGRSGFDPSIAPFSWVNLDWKSIKLDGDAHAEPLIVGRGVIVATENDSLYYLDADTGQVIWRTHLGTPVRLANFPCGNIDPQGITGTPAIDMTRRVVYAVAIFPPADHELFAVDLDNGTVRFHVPIDPPGADSTVEQQRAALALSGGYVYVAYGGRSGDCGAYHGWVVAARADGKGGLLSFKVPTGRAGGIWAPSGPAFVGKDLLVAAGNSDSNSTFDYGNSVIKLSPDLRLLDWFAAPNWIQLNANDLDLGSTGPMVLNSDFIFQIGKDGIGYLLDAKRLGGIGGQVFSAQVCGPYGGAYGGLAYSSPLLFVPCDDGLVALEMNLESNPSFTVAWRGPGFVSGPPIVAGNAVWTVDINRGLIYAFGLREGKILFKDTVGYTVHFTTPSAGYGQIFVSANRQLLSYHLVPYETAQYSYLLSGVAFGVFVSVVLFVHIRKARRPTVQTTTATPHAVAWTTCSQGFRIHLISRSVLLHESHF
jgi:outer membrane protein assembly factor BamB